MSAVQLTWAPVSVLYVPLNPMLLLSASCTNPSLEIEIRGNDIGGVAVHAAARVMSHCGSDEVLVSRVVTDLVAGAGLKFAERGSYELKGLPGKWDLFAASG
jgi:hypothetical protein